ncbi:glycosyl transferase family 36 [Lysobacter concretionis Ko07 = DSM 16239]|uniref:Glycosyl transferase family 36 n=2 Tax=Lysobacterales TaxID=135614 RepID=A0A0A0EKV7_9GAMM|nr:glycosyl transferase family 36 [Lysobacter concretionis Ko07 = DSM 16239]QOD92428.1 glycosyl transferase family 36 [Lysobacter sp. CW239]
MPSPPPQPRAVSRAHLLSNGRYTAMLTDAGSGQSQWLGLAITRWREDPTCDAWGSHILLRDADSGAVWSAGRQPHGGEPDSYLATATDGLFSSARHDGTLETRLTVAIAADCDAELRHLTISNHGHLQHVIELTSYAELVLASAASDAAHPAFSKMFVKTEWVEQGGVLLATRRRRAPEEPQIWAAHVALVEGQEDHTAEYETDRARFLGRGRTLRNAVAMENGDLLSGAIGDVLDPIFSLRRRVRIAPGASVRIAFWTCVATTREQVLALAHGVDGAEACEDVFARSADCSLARRAQFELGDAAAERCNRLLAPLFYADAAWRAPAEQLQRGSGGAPVLWGCGISGDRPIVLLHIASLDGLEHVHELLRAQRYWQSLRLGIDTVLLNDAAGTDAEALHAQLTALASAQTDALHGAEIADQTGISATDAGVFVLRSDSMDDALRDGLAMAARIVLDEATGGLAMRVAHADRFGISGQTREPGAVPGPDAKEAAAATTHALHEALEFDNGIGGFSAADDTYVIRLDGSRCTPMPWSNVVANPGFGFIATAEGGGHTFSLNSQQNPLTPWPNDPVSDAPCEVLYLRDNDSGELWSATALPIRVPTARYTTRHGRGWTRYSHEAHGVGVELLQCVPMTDSIKLSRLRLHNRSARPRRLSVTAYVQWALGANGTVPGPYVVTRQDPSTGAVFAQNRWRPEFGDRVAFAGLGGAAMSVTADRTEFLGVLGAVERPAALLDAAPLSGWTGAGRDPCAALQTQIDLAPDASADVLFLLGDAASDAEAQTLLDTYRHIDIDEVLRDVHALWNGVLDVLQVHTPNPAMDVLLNGWLLYQTLSCRMWARAAYYQSSGAYGFRDQLQDVMALCVARPDIAREHLLRAAGRQFVEGDVQHWWLPPSGQGIRTRMSDDRVWLPYVALHYLAVSGDAGVLDAVVPFLDGPLLKDGEHDAFFTPSDADQHGSLYEHCARAIDCSLSLGPHGLPLMGTGDWNDGMNRVGEQGKGESVWLAWLLLDTIARFSPIAEARADHARVARWQTFAGTVGSAVEDAGWDGAWYRRAYYDDGTPLGSALNAECRIDAIAQSWSLMSGAADPARAANAMAAVDTQLVDRRHRVAMLFTPPFEHTAHDPGYIRSYPPGVRENGGQYTHGSLWSIFAWARLGNGDKAAELFDIFNPVLHTSTGSGADHFKVEPYVSCADVYSVDKLAGRGGWTWYTGSAGWLYRAGIEALLGFHLRGDRLRIDPCIPTTWPGFSLVYRHHTSRYLVQIISGQIGSGPIDNGQVDNGQVGKPDGAGRGVIRAELDGASLAVPADDAAALIPLVDDGVEHHVRVWLG